MLKVLEDPPVNTEVNASKESSLSLTLRYDIYRNAILIRKFH